ncbi:MAG TPA: acetyl-CoA carboxylase biotin carboxyl carrier protein [Phaeodactylibacter sp.]|nr:acetyl-CoA carboxylase biotin carboxyl carrier protein [Phaeodactylibacter sp.]
MTFKEIQELIKLVNKNKLSEFKLKDGDFEIAIRTEKYAKSKAAGSAAQPQTTQIITQPAAATPPPPPAAAPVEKADEKPPAEDSSKYLEITSPMVGTFYRSSAPDKPPYVKVGDTVEPGTVVCIIEAMKLFNEIEAEVSGKIVKVMVEDAQPVEFGQVLFLVEPA